MQFGSDGVAELVPALLEPGEAFALELVGDAFEADADGGHLIEDAACIVVSAPDGILPVTSPWSAKAARVLGA
jgi:hypothetical protein